MKLSSLCLAIVVTCSLVCIAEDNADDAEKSRKIHEVYERKFGGFVVQPGSLAGRIVFVNGQKDLAVSEIEKVIATIKSGMAYNIVVVEGEMPSPMPKSQDLAKHKADVAIFVVSDSALPALLVSPEENWSIVNVAKCMNGLKDDVLGKRLFALRCRGELIRGFAQASGIWTSNYKDNILNAKSPTELDAMKGDSLVADILQRCKEHLARIGVTQERKVMYTRACHEGWAPAPTNEYQKAIWEKIKAEKSVKPSNPIKVNFDPRTAPKVGE